MRFAALIALAVAPTLLPAAAPAPKAGPPRLIAVSSHKDGLWGVYVVHEARGAGVGTLLISACIEHARRIEGVLQIHLTVASHNASAVRLYERCGVRRYGAEPRAHILPDGREIDEDLMVLLLDTAPPLPS